MKKESASWSYVHNQLVTQNIKVQQIIRNCHAISRGDNGKACTNILMYIDCPAECAGDISHRCFTGAHTITHSCIQQAGMCTMGISNNRRMTSIHTWIWHPPVMSLMADCQTGNQVRLWRSFVTQRYVSAPIGSVLRIRTDCHNAIKQRPAVGTRASLEFLSPNGGSQKIRWQSYVWTVFTDLARVEGLYNWTWMAPYLNDFYIWHVQKCLETK
jgi:hypothetical protein